MMHDEMSFSYNIPFSDNIKALYRRARAHVGAWNPDQAKEDFVRVAQLDPSLELTCKKEMKKLEDQEKAKQLEDRERLKNLF